MSSTNKKSTENKENSNDAASNEQRKKHEIQGTEKQEILKSQCELLAEELLKYKDQSSETAKLATKLKHELKKHDLKTTEMVAYLQNEIHQKDAEIEKLRKANILYRISTDNHEQSKQSALQMMTEKHTANYSSMESSLRSEITQLRRELASLEYVKENREKMENALLVAKATMETQARKFKLSIDQLESKYIVDTQRIRENADREIANLKNRAKEFAEQDLDAQSRTLRMENKKYQKDLSFHCKTTNVLHKENEKLAEDAKALRREIELLKQTEIEQSKQSVTYKQKMKQLNAKIQRLEKTLDEATDEWEKIRQQMAKNFRSELEALKRQNETLKTENKDMRGDLKALKQYSKTIVTQRTEVEQFFHEALNEVKRMVRRRLEDEYQQELYSYADSMRNLGLNAGSVEDQHVGKDEIGITPPTKLHEQSIKLEQLTLQEREHVLKVLISKINAHSGDLQSSIMKHRIDFKKQRHATQAVDHNESDHNKTFLTQKQMHEQP